MQQQQHNQKVQHDKHSKSHHFKQVDLVFIHDFHRGAAKPTWLPGTVTVDQIMRLNYVTITLLRDMPISSIPVEVIVRHADLIHTCESDCEDASPREEVDAIPVNTFVSVELPHSPVCFQS